MSAHDKSTCTRSTLATTSPIVVNRFSQSIILLVFFFKTTIRLVNVNVHLFLMQHRYFFFVAIKTCSSVESMSLALQNMYSSRIARLLSESRLSTSQRRFEFEEGVYDVCDNDRETAPAIDKLLKINPTGAVLKNTIWVDDGFVICAVGDVTFWLD